jgi:hypothetical protein
VNQQVPFHLLDQWVLQDPWALLHPCTQCHLFLLLDLECLAVLFDHVDQYFLFVLFLLAFLLHQLAQLDQ